MYNLPQSTDINKPLYKTAIFEKFNLKAAERERFDADISRMALVAYVAPSRVPALKEGQEVKDFYVLQVILKQQNYDTKNIMLLQKLIPQHIIFALEYNSSLGEVGRGLTQFCIFHTRLQQSEWMLTDDVALMLNGISIDDVWNNLVASIGNLDVSSEESIEQQIINREEREKLLQQIELLEKRCRVEKQTRKKYELHQKLLRLKEGLS